MCVFVDKDSSSDGFQWVASIFKKFVRGFFTHEAK
jgi:hypothetical protein